jgi:DtxR family Mn-dependent transcriptional regulator
VEPPKTEELSKSEESYVETIHSLIKEYGYARVADIANTLEVKPPSVTNMLQKLDEQKFVDYTRYRGVVLTGKGQLLAETLERRHRAVKQFLMMIGVSEKNAEKDACEIEHQINHETAEKLAKFVEFVRTAPQPPPFLKNFRQFDRTGKRPKHCRASKKE